MKKIDEISMKYYNIFTKYILAIIVIVNIIGTLINVSYIQNTQDYSIGIFVIASLIIRIIIPIQLKDKLTLRKKTGYKLVIIYLVLDYIYSIIFSLRNIYVNNPIFFDEELNIYIIIASILYGIWYIPNLIYFIKRKNIFEDNIEKE